MKPRLYPENETNFESNGLGPLSDALACTVEENRNGAFELSMEYPVTGVLFDELKHGSIIFAPPNDSSEPQPFRVYGKSTPLSGVVTVRAKHISYRFFARTSWRVTTDILRRRIPGNAAQRCGPRK